MKNKQHIGRKEFEKLLNDSNSSNDSSMDAFERDALEGWKASGVPFSKMGHTDKLISKKYFGNFFNSSYFILSSAAVIVAAAGFFLLKNNHEKHQPQKQQLVIERNEVSLPEKIDTLVALTKETQISTQDLISKHTIEKEQPKEITSSQPVDFENMTEIVLEPLPAVIEDREVKLTEQRMAKEVYYHHLKAIDYSQYRSKPEVKIEQIILSGVPANYETEEDIQAVTETRTKTVMIPYMDYLERTLGYLEKEKWKLALSRCEEILSSYPDDINAIFYSGLCYYNLQQYQKACDRFSSCVQLNWANFNEEATWYLAKSRLANKEKSIAKELFTAIRDNKGYYAKQAEKILKDWK